MHDPLMPPDVDPGPLDPDAEEQWNRWANGLVALLGVWVVFLGICAGALVAWAWQTGLIGTP